MSQHRIVVEKVGKQFQLGQSASYGRLSELLQNGLLRYLRRRSSRSESKKTFWALQDISFQVDDGQVLGIIGRNGAGKSTLLKLLSRITRPTTGRLGVRGRVGSLLEVGTGFHPELTGRENVFLNGAILGMSRQEVRRKFDAIVSFAGVDDFMDTPVKHYSSGMYVRLAFSVAAHLETDVLIVDEVLAVGDVEFQRKCLGRMNEASRSGRTVLFVSHNLATVRQLCTQTLLLERGMQHFFGPTDEAIMTYLAMGHQSSGQATWNSDKRPHRHEDIELCAVRVIPEAGASPNAEVDICHGAIIEIEFEVTTPGGRYFPAMVITDSNGSVVLSTIAGPGFNTSPSPWYQQQFTQGTYIARCTIPPDFLNDVEYSITVMLSRFPQEILVRADDVLVFRGYDTGSMREAYTTRISGVVRPRLAWTVLGPGLNNSLKE